MRVVIAEDLSLLRDGMTRMLTAYGFDVVAAVEDGSRLAETLVSLRPDVAVVDVRLPPTFTDEGVRAALAARRAVPGLPVLVLSQYVEQVYPGSCCPTVAAESAICSRTGWARCANSWRRCGAWPTAAR
jgi:DNA-binding NarL/FixJ family response regulator